MQLYCKRGCFERVSLKRARRNKGYPEPHPWPLAVGEFNASAGSTQSKSYSALTAELPEEEISSL